jgi:hypothetical protein
MSKQELQEHMEMLMNGCASVCISPGFTVSIWVLFSGEIGILESHSLTKSSRPFLYLPGLRLKEISVGKNGDEASAACFSVTADGSGSSATGFTTSTNLSASDEFSFCFLVMEGF